jgi:bifunctional non-homologous end joining protein LigD
MIEDVNHPRRLARPVAPMLATPGPVPTGAGWAFEFKWDGVRAIVDLADGRVRLTSRNLKDMSGSYPDLAGPAGGRRLLLDGEIVALDPATGAPSFARLQQRMHVLAPSQQLLASVPVRLYVFDVLEIDGQATVDRPYEQRRALLDELDLNHGGVQTPPSFAEGRRGADLLVAAREQDLEGVVAKRLQSPYRPGRRSPDWVKTPLERTAEALIVGWRPGAGRREGMIGSLVLGAHDRQGRLVHIGDVGTGFTHHALRQLADRLAPLARDSSPLDQPPAPGYARDARWVEPVLVGDVAYRTLSPDGRLRHPSWRGLRADRDAADVSIENLQ